MYETASTAPYNCVHVVRKCWFDFWFVFGSFLMLVRLQKPNQNIRICGMVLVWFKPEPKPNGYMYSRMYVHNIIVLYTYVCIYESSFLFNIINAKKYYIYIHTQTHTHTHIYIYIYIFIYLFIYFNTFFL